MGTKFSCARRPFPIPYSPLPFCPLCPFCFPLSLSMRGSFKKVSEHQVPNWVQDGRFSLSPDPDVIHSQLLRERRAGVRTADEIASDRDVENDKELSLELRCAVDPPRDVAFVILHAVQVPPDGRGGAGD